MRLGVRLLVWKVAVARARTRDGQHRDYLVGLAGANRDVGLGCRFIVRGIPEGPMFREISLIWEISIKRYLRGIIRHVDRILSRLPEHK